MTTMDELNLIEEALEEARLALGRAKIRATEDTARIAALEDEVASLEAKLAACEDGGQPEPPPAWRTLWGGTARAPGSGVPSNEVDYIRGKSQPQVLDILIAEQGQLVGDPSYNWGIFHGYNAGMPTDFKGTEANLVLSRGDMVALLNVKPNQSAAAAASSGTAAAYKALVESCPTDRRTYICTLHEPENVPAGQTFNDPQWRKAVAQTAKWILTYREDRDVVPVICVINWNLHPDNPGNHVANDLKKPIDNHFAKRLNPTQELLALGVPLNHVVYTTDGYTLAGKVAQNKPTDVYGPTCALVKSWGFQRFGVSEGACKSQSAADRAATGAWIDDLETLATRENWEFFCWYNSGVGPRAEPEGWYIYGDTNKRAFAEAVAG